MGVNIVGLMTGTLAATLAITLLIEVHFLISLGVNKSSIVVSSGLNSY